jgi:hypothetical protein
MLAVLRGGLIPFPTPRLFDQRTGGWKDGDALN